MWPFSIIWRRERFMGVGYKTYDYFPFKNGIHAELNQLITK